MKLEIANRILDELTDGELREDYSGRSMYGKITYGIVTKYRNDIFEAIERINEEDEGEHINADDIQFDSMGLSIIAY